MEEELDLDFRRHASGVGDLHCENDGAFLRRIDIVFGADVELFVTGAADHVEGGFDCYSAGFWVDLEGSQVNDVAGADQRMGRWVGDGKLASTAERKNFPRLADLCLGSSICSGRLIDYIFLLLPTVVTFPANT